MNNEKYMKIIDILADKIYMLDLDNSSLKYANKRLEEKVKELEDKLYFYTTCPCEEDNKEVC